MVVWWLICVNLEDAKMDSSPESRPSSISEARKLSEVYK